MLVRRITYAERDDRVAAAFQRDMGAGYDVPWPLPNMKPIDPSVFWHWMSAWTPQATAYAGHRRFEGVGGTVKVFYVDTMNRMKGGFAILIGDYGKNVLFFEWCACDHAWTSRSRGNCLHEYRCEKCGSVYDIDSSG